MQEDPEFEKQIRQRMEELKFSPSKTVWDNLEKEITKDKRRRRPLIWLSLFLAIGLAGTFYFVRNAGSVHDNNNISVKENATNASSEKDKSQQNSANDKNVTLSDKKNSEVETKQSSLNTSDKIDKIEGSKNKKNIPAGNKRSGKKINQKNPDALAGDFLTVNKLSKGKKISKDGTRPGTPDNEIKNEIVADELNANDDKHTYLNDKVETPGENQNAVVVIPKTDNNAQKKSTSDKALENKSSSKKDVAQNKKSKNKKPWELGITGGAGMSSVNENLFNTAAAVSSPNAYYQSFSLAAAPPPPIYNAPSSSKAGFSFSAGILMQKEIAKKLVFSTGLNYHYSSTKISTTAYGYYGVAQPQSYTNHFHILELPVSLSYQLNKSRRVPLFIEGGLSVAELIGSDAMHYNSSTGTYFKDNKLFNKTQLNAATAVMIGLHPAKHLYFQVGPQVQYGITNLLTADASGSQHLFFGGVKIVFIPNKK